MKKSKDTATTSLQNLVHSWSFIEHLPDAFWAVDANLHLIIANAKCKEMFRHITGKEMRIEEVGNDFKTDKNYEFWLEMNKKGLEGEVFNFEYSVIIEKEIFYFDITVNPIIQDQKVIAITFVCKNITDSKKTKLEYLDTLSSYKQAMQFARMGAWTLNLVTFELTMTPEKLLILNYPSHRLFSVSLPLNEYAQKHVYPDDLPIIQANLSLLIENKHIEGYSLSFDYRAIGWDGNIRNLHLKCYIKKDEEVFGFSQDIHERKEAESALSESRALYEKLIETLPNMMIIHHEGVIIYGNQALYSISGYLPEEVIGKKIVDFVHTTADIDTHSIIEKRKRGESVPAYQFALLTKHGEWLELRVNGTSVNYDGKLCTLVVFENLTTILQSQKALQEKNTLLTSVINSPNNTIIFSLDKEGRYTSFNDNHAKRMYQQLGVNIALGEKILHYFPEGEGKEKATSQIQRALSGESFRLTENFGTHPNKFYYDMSYNPILNPQGEIIGLTAFLFDVTNMVRTEKTLRNTQLESEAMFENTFDAVFLVDLYEQTITRCNIRATKVFETENKEDILQKLGFGHFIPDCFDIEHIKETIQNGMIWEGEHTFKTAKGNSFVGYVLVKKIPQIKGKELAILKIIDITHRKKAEQQLIAKQRQLKAIIENTEDNIWLIDSEYKLLEANSAFKLYIFENHQIPVKEGLNLIEDIPSMPFSYRLKWKNWYDIALKGEPLVAENEVVLNNNQKNYFENYLYPVREGNEIVGVAVLSRNITERRLKEEQIRKSEEQLSYAIAATKEGVWDWDVNQKTLKGNQALYDLLKFRSFEISGHIIDLIRLIHPNDAWVKVEIKKVLNGQLDSFEWEFKMLTMRGEEIWVRWRGRVAEKNALGKVVRLVGTLENITERKVIQDELFAQKRFIEQIINAVPSLIFVKNQEGQYQLVNKAFAAFYKKTPFEIIGKTDDDIISGSLHQYKELYINTDLRVLDEKQPIFVAETQTVDELTQEVSYYQTVKLLLENHEKGNQILGVATDISTQKKSEIERTKLIEELIQNIQDLEQFAYIVSHNLRSPVARILGLAHLLEKEDIKKEFIDFVMKTMADEAKQLDNIIGDLNTIVAFRGIKDEKRESILIHEVLKTVMDSLQSEMIKNEVIAHIHVGENTPVLAIKTYVHSILLNLVSNAIKYRHPQRPLQLNIDITPNESKTKMCVKVSDNGLGIDLEKNRDKLFGLYKRFHPHIEGKGIGLHITKIQIERMNGSIEVESTPDEGTTFYLCFELANR